MQTQNNKRGKGRRVVTTIMQRPEPRDIFRGVSGGKYEYVEHKLEYSWRDMAAMGAVFITGGRNTEVFGGPQFQRCVVDNPPPKIVTEEFKLDGVWMERHYGVFGGRTKKEIDEAVRKNNIREIVIGYHEGLTMDKVTLEDEQIIITDMIVVKRSPETLRKNPTAAVRQKFLVPLVRDKYENPYWNQLIPFAWLVKRWIHTREQLLDISGNKLFPFEDTRAWQIVKNSTGWYPNWFAFFATLYTCFAMPI